MILADTSVWIDHLRRGNTRLASALEDQEIVTHPFVIGELACGELRDRRALLGLLHRLPTATLAAEHEALAFIENHRLMGRGLGYLDVHLLASVALSPSARLWTFDLPLATAATKLGMALS